jgi:hypothetical protein
MLSKNRVEILKDKLFSKKMDIFTAGYARDLDRWAIEKIHAEDIKKLNDQIEILDVVLTYNK